MALEFTSFGQAAAHCAKIALAVHEEEKSSLERATKFLQTKVKEKFGEYQPVAGQFVAWASLADYTVADRERQGYEPDEPLLREGDLRESVQTLVRDHEGYVGSNMDIAVYQELGTVGSDGSQRIPPRSTFGGAAVENMEAIGNILGEGAVMALVGKDVFEGRIEINSTSATPMLQPSDLGFE